MSTFSQRYAAADSNIAGSFYFDTIAAVDYPASKVLWGAEGAVNHASAATPLPVTVITSALPTGAATAGNQTTANAALAAIAGSAGSIDSKIFTCDTGAVVIASGTLTDAQVQGKAAHDAAVSGNPLLLGAYASNASPAQVSADGDAVRLWADRAGRLQIGDGGSTLSIDDGAGSITVDTDPGAPLFVAQSGTWDINSVGSITGTVTVDTELPAAASITSENTAAPTAPSIYAFGMVFDGANWDRLPGTSVDGVLVNLGANNDVDTELPAAAALADGAANPTAPAVGASLLIYNGTTWDRGRGDTTNGLDVDVTRVPTDPFGANADAASATGSISAKLRFIASTGIPITGNPGVSQSGTWTVQPGNTANTTPWLVSDQAATTGGTSLPYSFLSTAAVQAAAIKASAGQVYALHFFNKGASPVYVRLYNQTASPATTDTPVYRAIVPGNTAGAGFVVPIPPGCKFDTGIGIRVTGAIADNDATALAANEVIGNVFYK